MALRGRIRLTKGHRDRVDRLAFLFVKHLRNWICSVIEAAAPLLCQRNQSWPFFSNRPARNLNWNWQGNRSNQRYKTFPFPIPLKHGSTNRIWIAVSLRLFIHSITHLVILTTGTERVSNSPAFCDAFVQPIIPVTCQKGQLKIDTRDLRKFLVKLWLRMSCDDCG